MSLPNQSRDLFDSAAFLRCSRLLFSMLGMHCDLTELDRMRPIRDVALLSLGPCRGCRERAGFCEGSGPSIRRVWHLREAFGCPQQASGTAGVVVLRAEGGQLCW